MEKIVEFARLIGKNTADFTVWDIQRYIDYLWGKPIKRKGEKMAKQEEIEMTITKEEAEALIFSIEAVLQDYDFSENERMKDILTNILEALKEYV
jgi:Zn-dependent M16 (insulinase) family peptidase